MQAKVDQDSTNIKISKYWSYLVKTSIFPLHSLKASPIFQDCPVRGLSLNRDLSPSQVPRPTAI